MDAREYDRIADLLCQIRSKYDRQRFQDSLLKRSIIEHLIVLIQLNDECADLDEKGLL